MAKKLDGYKRVQPTREEIAEWARKNPTAAHNFPYRVECEECGRRLWCSGMGIGSHNRYHARLWAQKAEERKAARETN